VQAHEGKHKDLVKFIAHQTCISPVQITQLLTVKFKEEIFVNKDFKQGININNDFTEDPHAVAFQKCVLTHFFLNPVP